MAARVTRSIPLARRIDRASSPTDKTGLRHACPRLVVTGAEQGCMDCCTDWRGCAVMLPIGNGIEATGDSTDTDVQLFFRGVGMVLMDAGPVNGRRKSQARHPVAVATRPRVGRATLRRAALKWSGRRSVSVATSVESITSEYQWPECGGDPGKRWFGGNGTWVGRCR